ncbi:MAG: hypothetical protein RR531_13625 [Longicatena sp.]
MAKYLRCNQCGYDLYGPEYLSNVIDPFSYSSDAYYPGAALLTLCTKPDNEVECPFCHAMGNWSH